MQHQSILVPISRRFLRVVFLVVVSLLAAGLASPEARGQAFSSLHSFIAPVNGAYPLAAVIQGQDGALYGTTELGGVDNDGTVFKVNPDGTGFQTLHSFSGSDGASPFAAVIEGQDGALYGTTPDGGVDNDGTVFKVNPDGTGFQTLHSFNSGDGAGPVASLIQGQDGALYGTTEQGGLYGYSTGLHGYGTVFKVNPDGTGFQTLHSFSGDDSFNDSDGAFPLAAVIQGKDGALYGTTYDDGGIGFGMVFKVNTDGTGYQTLHSFSGNGSSGDGACVSASLIQGKDGALYGTTEQGGANDGGTVFKVNSNGIGFQTLHIFGGGSDGVNPYAALMQGKDGALYGTASGTVFKVNLDGTGFQALYNFSGSSQASLIQGLDGALYGTTVQGGVDSRGSVFKVKPDGTDFQTLYSFSGDGRDNPSAALLQGRDGALYGTTELGGVDSYGTVFKVNPDGTGFQTLYTFSGGDGALPVASLMQGQDGALYGATKQGGAARGYGTVFKVNPDGTGFQTLHSFGYSDGIFPVAALIQGQDGALYGTTQHLPASSRSPGSHGTVFKVNADGTDFQILHSFSGSDGTGSLAAVIQGQGGVLYGTTPDGGATGYGTVFKVNPDGTGFQTLYSFSGSDGGNPSAAVIQGQDGALYGTTPGGGATGYGTVFKVNPDGTGFQTLYSFSGSDGANSQAAVIQGQDGALYGTTSDGGATGYGTVFKVNTDGTGFQTLHSFSGTDGAYPYAAVIQGQDGALYGTTYDGGDYGLGSVFRLALVIDVTDEVQVSSSGLTYNSVTRLYTGTLTIKNNNRNAIGGPIQAVLNHLPAGVTLVNANGTYHGAPYVTANITSLAPRAIIHLPLQFRVASGNGRIGYSITVYSGTP